MDETRVPASDTADERLATMVVADLAQAGLITAEASKKLLARITAGRMTPQDWSGLFELARPVTGPGGAK
jgi:hypothetical protein